jgi:AraC-like DNA-binding protein
MGAGTSSDAVFAQSFSTRDLAPEDQFDAWRSMLAETIDLLPTEESSKAFEADFSCWSFGDVVFTRTVYAKAPARQWRHRPKSFLDHWCVVLARSASGGESSLSLTNAQPDSLSFRSLAMPFEGRAEDSEVLTLFLPRDFGHGELGDFERAHDLGIEPEFQGLLSSYMDNLARYLPHISPERAQGLSTATCSLVAACIGRHAEHLEAARVPLASLLIDRARLVVRQNMASPDFGPEQLARLMAMSRSKLYRFFESVGGVAHFINRERLREAHRRLNAPRDALSIHIIGNEVGFVDHSTFSRAFRREFGYSPTEARERSLARLSVRGDGAHALGSEPRTAAGEAAGMRRGTAPVRMLAQAASQEFGMSSAELGF